MNEALQNPDNFAEDFIKSLQKYENFEQYEILSNIFNTTISRRKVQIDENHKQGIKLNDSLNDLMTLVQPNRDTSPVTPIVVSRKY